MEKNFVTFVSPGTFVQETTTKEIKKWDPKIAFEMSKKITERYDAKPFGFYFTTRGRGPKDLDSKITKESEMFYLLSMGEVRTREEVEKDNLKEEEILRLNMKNNDIDKIFQTTKGWKWTAPLGKKSKLVDENGNVVKYEDICKKSNLLKSEKTKK